MALRENRFIVVASPRRIYIRPFRCKFAACFKFELNQYYIYSPCLAAINECGLVYDGGLVVGPTFDTNDPHIYAAGTCVRYSRRLYAKQHLHRFFCSEDVGEAVRILKTAGFTDF